MTKCLAPWAHTYCSPQGERRMCCASREPSQNFKQYIDSNKTLKDKPKEEVIALLKDRQEFKPLTLAEHWNSEHMMSVRKRMMAGEELPECEVCDKKLLNTSVYSDYFEHMFKHRRKEFEDETDADGMYHQDPISFDYRFSNLCNFKCRMCGPPLSSSWEAEVKKHDLGIADYEPWMKHKAEISDNQLEMFEELKKVIREGNLRELYWVGGEPIMFAEHWDVMHMLLRTDNAKDVYVRYNTNLSVITNKTHATDIAGMVSSPRGYPMDVFHVLKGFKDWQMNCSLDGTGIIGEYIRTGLDYNKFIENYKVGLANSRPDQMRLDFTLTTPGLFEIENMFNLSKKTGSQLLTKVCFEFSSDIPMCPLFLPKDVLHGIIEPLLRKLKPLTDHNQQPLIDVLEQLLTRETMEEKYDDYLEGRKRGKAKIDKMESRRLGPVSMTEIFAQNNQQAYEFWDAI